MQDDVAYLFLVTLLHVLVSLAAFISLCAVVYPFRPFSSRGKAFLSFLGLCFLNIVLVLASFPSSTTDKAATGSNSTNPYPVSNTSPKPDVEVAPQNWEYSETTDEMTGKITKFACTKSSNSLEFAFPYSGGATGELCFRRKGNSLNSYIRVSTGQFNCGIDNCDLRLKFDDGAIQNFSGEESATHETGFLFIEAEQRLLASTLKAKKLKLQAQYYQEGNQVLNFDVSGLDPKQF